MASVLVVEDDQFVRSALIRQLTDASHTVRSVGTALEALREVAHFRFDVVVLDLGLPDLDGSEALKMLRAASPTSPSSSPPPATTRRRSCGCSTPARTTI